MYTNSLRQTASGSSPAIFPRETASLRKLALTYAHSLLRPLRGGYRLVIAEAIQHSELGAERHARGKKRYLPRLEALIAEAVTEKTMRVPEVAVAVRQLLAVDSLTQPCSWAPHQAEQTMTRTNVSHSDLYLALCVTPYTQL